MPGEGEYVATELFYMRVGTLRLRRRWIDPDAVLRGQIFLTALSAVVLLSCGFALGWLAAGLSGRGGGGGVGGIGGVAAPMAAAVSFGRGYRGHGHRAELVSSSWLDEVRGLDLDDGAGRACDCDCAGRVGELDGIDLVSGTLGNVSSLY